MRGFLITTVGLAFGLLVAVPTLAGAQGPGEGQPPRPERATLRINVEGKNGARAKVGRRVRITGTLRPFAARERVKVLLLRSGKVVKRRTKKVRRRGSAGRVTWRSKRLVRPGRYRAKVVHPRSRRLSYDEAGSGSFKLKYPRLRGSSRGKEVKIFHRLLRRQGYRNAPGGSRFNSATKRAVHAFRKVNGMARTSKASPEIFKRLADGKGRFRLKRPGAGKHVEIDISRQVMVLAKRRKARFTYHVSTGAPGTPSDRGKFRFYRKDAGFNSIGMYYSVYYNRGEATHGYHSVPDYPASHGCIRNPIPDSVFIYRWIDLGDRIYVYD